MVQAFYGSVAAYSYFAGCSTGGGQALHEAQQFPDDYDGILAGAPAENRTHLHTEIIWPYVVSHRTPDSLIPPDKTQLITNAVLAACANGGQPSDRYLTEPRACRWDPEKLLCQDGANDTSQCLTPAQVDTAQMLSDGRRDPRTGRLIYPGVPRGSESGSTFDWTALQGLSPTLPATEPLFDGLFYWAFGANWDWRSFDFDGNVFQLDDVLARILNANNPDLTRFRAHGGKLLGFHGWADALVPPQDFVNYYLRVGAWLSILDRDPALPEASNFASSVAENFRVNSVTESDLGVRVWGEPSRTVRSTTVGRKSSSGCSWPQGWAIAAVARGRTSSSTRPSAQRRRTHSTTPCSRCSAGWSRGCAAADHRDQLTSTTTRPKAWRRPGRSASSRKWRATAARAM